MDEKSRHVAGSSIDADASSRSRGGSDGDAGVVHNIQVSSLSLGQKLSLLSLLAVKSAD